MAKPTVSVIIPTYNCARYLSGCIESVLAQTWGNYEVIVVNDGSTDDTESAIQPFLKDPRIRYIRQKNGGHGNARNNAIKHSEGRYIAFLDADDLWDPTKLEKQLNLFKEPAVGLVYCPWKAIDEGGREVDFHHESEYLRFRSGRVTEYLFYDNFLATPSAVIRHECLKKAGIFDETIRIGEDWDLWLRISVHYEILYVDEPLISVRIARPGKVSTNVELRHECTDRIRKKFLEEYPSVLSARVIRMALAYSYCQRGYYYRKGNVWKAFFYYLSAIKMWPQDSGAWKGLLKIVPFLVKSGIKGVLSHGG